MIIKFNGYNEGLRQLKDRSWKVTIETQELKGSQVADLSDFSGQYVKIMMTDENVSNEMLEIFRNMDVMAEEGSKTPSKRLRDRLFIYWKQQKLEGDFEMFYRQKIENIINQIPLQEDIENHTI